MLFLGIDVGTTSLKAGLFDAQGAAQAVATEEYDLITPAADQVQVEAEVYWQACVRTVARVLASANAPRREIVGIGVSSQGETLIPVDRQGRPLRHALVWLDNRATPQAARIAEHFDRARVYAVTGIPEIVATWTACKILWLRENEPTLYQAVHKFLLVEDYLLYRLTGRFATDGSVACTTLLWDLKRGGWWDEMLEFLDLDPARLPEPVVPGEVVGALTPAAAEELGLAPATRVVACGMDQASGAVGAGNIRPGIVSESTGGALAIQATVPLPDLDATGRLPIYVHDAPGLYLAVPVCPTGGMALKWFRDTFAVEPGRGTGQGFSMDYDQLVHDAEQVEPGCEGLTMLPHLMGAFSPEYNAQARGVFYGFTLRHSRAHFARAVLESVAFMLKRNLDLIVGLGVPVDAVRSMGGGAKSRTWLQIKADVTGLPIETLELQETALLGNAVLAAVAVEAFPTLEDACAAMVRVSGRIEPQLAPRAAYAQAYDRYCAVYDHLEGLFCQAA